MQWRRFAMWLATVAVTVVVLLAGLGSILLTTPDFTPYAHRQMPASSPRTGDLRARYLGVTTLLLSDGNHAILIDGFFSRPDRRAMLFRRIAPNQDRIERALARVGANRLDAVIVAHSHHDHAMDAPVVAWRTRAELVGSASIATMARGYPHWPLRMTTVHGGEELSYGSFKVTVIPSPHSPHALFPGPIEAPLTPPVWASAYREGESFSFLVEHRGHRLLIHPSAGVFPGMYRDIRADVVFLGIGMLGRQDETSIDTYWREVVLATHARRVIPIHWDDFTRRLMSPLPPAPLLLGDFRGGMEAIDQRKGDVEVVLPPPYVPIDVLAMLGGARESALAKDCDCDASVAPATQCQPARPGAYARPAC